MFKWVWYIVPQTNTCQLKVIFLQDSYIPIQIYCPHTTIELFFMFCLKINLSNIGKYCYLVKLIIVFRLFIPSFYICLHLDFYPHLHKDHFFCNLCWTNIIKYCNEGEINNESISIITHINHTQLVYLQYCQCYVCFKEIIFPT